MAISGSQKGTRYRRLNLSLISGSQKIYIKTLAHPHLFRRVRSSRLQHGSPRAFQKPFLHKEVGCRYDRTDRGMQKLTDLGYTGGLVGYPRAY